MGNITKLTFIFTFNPDIVTQNVVAPGRVAGFSESYWVNRIPTSPELASWAQARARCLAADCAIIGWRSTGYTYNGNKVTPGATIVGSFLWPGQNTHTTNSPDDALRIRGTANTIQHTWSFFLRAIPDVCIVSNQYVETVAFNEAINEYLGRLASGLQIGQKIMWFGRDPTVPKARVLEMGNPVGTVLASQDLAVANNVDSLRLNRVYDQNGRSVKGVYTVQAQAVQAGGAVLYTLRGLQPFLNPRPSGTVHKDQLLAAEISTAQISHVGERKAGRPSLAFRGRRSRTR